MAKFRVTVDVMMDIDDNELTGDYNISDMLEHEVRATLNGSGLVFQDITDVTEGED